MKSAITLLLDMKGDIAQEKEDTREETGAFKYDFAYDECLDLADKCIRGAEGEYLELAKHLAKHLKGNFYWSAEEIYKLIMMKRSE